MKLTPKIYFLMQKKFGDNKNCQEEKLRDFFDAKKYFVLQRICDKYFFNDKKYW